MSWWKHGVIYQIYPRSFQDTNDDGIGDLQGIIDRLDYLASLPIDAIWISPIFCSPMADFGYDVSDYTDIDPMFGDLATFDRLLDAAHERNIKVILDYVPNHSSDRHPWFIESQSSRDNPRANWYIWRDARPDGSLPNNWLAVFGGPAWEWSEARQQYYLHMFLKEQPDLNWANPAVEQALLDVIRFWMVRGVDGLRMDVIHFILKHPDLPDNPVKMPSVGAGPRLGAFDSLEHVYDINYPPERQKRISTIRAVLDEYPDRVGIGETMIMEPEGLMPFYGANLDGLHMPFNFMVMFLDWDAPAFRRTIEGYYRALPEGAWPNFVLGNHDFHRLATRYAPENARAAMLLLLTLWGTPTWYYGDELGMQNVAIPREKEQDPFGMRVPGLNVGRDPERTPMQWDDSPNAGFASAGVDPWLPLADDYQVVNVAAQSTDPASHLSAFRALLQLRRDLPVLHAAGTFAFVDDLPQEVLAYTRKRDGQQVLTLVNFGGREHVLDFSPVHVSGEVLFDTGMNRRGEVVDMHRVALRPHEGVLLRLG